MKLIDSSAGIQIDSLTQYDLIGDQEVSLASVNSSANPAFDLIGLTKLRNDPQFAGIDGSGFSIAVIDTGIDKQHSLLAPNYIAGYDFVNDNDNLADKNGHGTHVSGTVGATDPNIGVAIDVGLIGLKALNDNGSGSLSDIEDSLEWVLANQEKYNITAVNLSFGVGHFTSGTEYGGDILSDDIDRLEQAGVTVISATGNNYYANSGKTNQANIAFPAVASTIAVGAVWQDSSTNNFLLPTGSKDITTGADRIASFSQRLDAPNVVFAPGAMINSTVSGGGLDGRAGTSQAVPHVAGVVALMQEASMQFNKRLLTPDEVVNILGTTGDTIFDGDDEDDNVVNTNTSYSRINVYNAITKIKTLESTVVSLPESKADSVIPDLNGTIAGARLVGLLNDQGTRSFTGTIGKDKEVIGNNDVDLYIFELSTSGLVGLEVSANVNNQADFNSYLRLFDYSGNQIAFNDDINEKNSFSRLEVNLEPGKYHVGVSGSTNSKYDPNIANSGIAADTGNYKLGLSLSYKESDTITNDTQKDIADTNNTQEDIAEPISDRNNQTQESVDSVDEISSPVKEPSNNIIENQDPILEDTPEPISDRDNEIPESADSVDEVPSSAISDDILASGSTVHRFFRADMGVHFYTANETERDVIEETLPQFNYEGASFIAADSSADSLTGVKPVHRFLNISTGTHLYTIDETEREFVDSNLDNYDYEGVAYHAYENELPGTTALYRFYNTDTNTHFYTPSSAERDFVSANLPSYQQEGNSGIVFYVEPIG